MFKKKCANCESEFRLNWNKTVKLVKCESCSQQLRLTAISRGMYTVVVILFFLSISVFRDRGFGFVLGISIPCVFFLVYVIQPLVARYEVKGK